MKANIYLNFTTSKITLSHIFAKFVTISKIGVIGIIVNGETHAKFLCCG